jgi:hypothetical protein
MEFQGRLPVDVFGILLMVSAPMLWLKLAGVCRSWRWLLHQMNQRDAPRFGQIALEAETQTLHKMHGVPIAVQRQYVDSLRVLCDLHLATASDAGARLLTLARLQRVIERIREVMWYFAESPNVTVVHVEPNRLKAIDDGMNPEMLQEIDRDGGMHIIIPRPGHLTERCPSCCDTIQYQRRACYCYLARQLSARRQWCAKCYWDRTNVIIEKCIREMEKLVMMDHWKLGQVVRIGLLDSFMPITSEEDIQSMMDFFQLEGRALPYVIRRLACITRRRGGWNTDSAKRALLQYLNDSRLPVRLPLSARPVRRVAPSWSQWLVSGLSASLGRIWGIGLCRGRSEMQEHPVLARHSVGVPIPLTRRVPQPYMAAVPLRAQQQQQPQRFGGTVLDEEADSDDEDGIVVARAYKRGL